MKFTAQQIKFALAIDNPALLEQCKVNKSDREYHPDSNREETKTFEH
jgi:hypothetical protein